MLTKATPTETYNPTLSGGTSQVTGYSGISDRMLSESLTGCPGIRNDGHDNANRASLYANARAQNLERWSGKTRICQPTEPVWLNPEIEISAPKIRDAP
jgi:hypothetical protein